MGKVGADISLTDGQKAAELVMLNILATVKGTVGSLERVYRLVKLLVFVNSAPGFVEQHKVADGATDLLVRVFGSETGKPARSAVGVAELPLNLSVEIEAILEIRD
jgi:enamine deaminase RidA (YjgF/YER057c/UK114 family)